ETLVTACLNREAHYRLENGDCGRVLGRNFCKREDMPLGLTPKVTTGRRQGSRAVPPNPPRLRGRSEYTNAAEGETGPYGYHRGEVASSDWKRNDNTSHDIVELVVPLSAHLMAVMACDTGDGDSPVR